MSLSKGSQYSAADFVALKARIKAEMLRRSHNGDLSAYGGSAYDFTTAETPGAGKQLGAGAARKIIEPMNAITPQGVETPSGGSFAKTLKTVADNLTVYEQDQMVRNGHNSCNAACSGMCVSGCWNSCSGCSGCSGCGSACSSNCDGCSVCGGACSSSCSGTCTGGCSGECYQGCKGCQDTCTGGCGRACSTGCTGACTGGCYAYCASTCKGGNS